MKRKVIAFTLVLMFACVLLVPPVLGSSMLAWPVSGEVVTGYIAGSHRGIDIAAPAGSAVAAADEGVVYWVGRTPRGEPCISIDHPNGLTTSYLPVESSVAKGQRVSRGETLGTLTEGDVSSDEPHLHFGLFETESRNDKRYLDPLEYLPPTATGQASRENATPVAERNDGANEAGAAPGAEPVPAAHAIPADAGQVASAALREDVAPRPAGAPQPRRETASSWAPAAAQPGASYSVSGVQPAHSATAASSGSMPGVSEPSSSAFIVPNLVLDGSVKGNVSAIGAASVRSADYARQSAVGALEVSGIVGYARAARTQPAGAVGGPSHAIAGPNPFNNHVVRGVAAAPRLGTPDSAVSRVEASAGPDSEGRRVGTVEAQARAFFGWELLPDLIWACALTAILMRGYRFAKRARARALPSWQEAGVGGTAAA